MAASALYECGYSYYGEKQKNRMYQIFDWSKIYKWEYENNFWLILPCLPEDIK